MKAARGLLSPGAVLFSDGVCAHSWAATSGSRGQCSAQTVGVGTRCQGSGERRVAPVFPTQAEVR